MKELITKNYKLYFFFLIPAILIFLYAFLYNKGIFLFSGDTYEQTFKFYLGGIDKIHSSTLGYWDWSLGFGANIFSYSLYFITSPVFWFTALFSKDFLPYSLLIANIIQFWLSCIFTHMWVSKFSSSKIAPIICAFLFAFSGWSLGYMRYEWSLMAIVFYPLILYFTEIYLANKKFVTLCIVIGLLGISNFLLLYQFLPFLYLYTLFRYLIIHQSCLQFKTTLIEALKFFLLTIIGVGISCIVLLPAAYVIFSTPRFADSDSISLLSIYGFPELYKIFSSLFTPVFERQNVNFFINSTNHKFIGWGGGGSLYSLIITPLLLPLIFFIKDKFKKKIYLVLIIIMIIFTLFPFFSYLFNRSIDVRWISMIVLTNILICAEIIDNLDSQHIKFKYLMISQLFLCLVFACLFIISYSQNLNNTQSLFSLLKSSILLILISFCYTLLIKKKAYKILIILLALESSYCGYWLFKYNKPVDYRVFENANLNDPAVNWLKNYDKSFYRTLYDLKKINLNNDVFDIITSNEPLAQGFKGVSFYSSLYNINQTDFLNRFLTSVNMPQTIGRESIYNLLSTKYFYTSAVANQPIPYGYKLIESNNDFKIYQNTNFVNLGYTCPANINKETVISKTYLDQDRIMQEYCISENSNNYDFVLHDNLQFITTFEDAETRIYEFEKPLTNARLIIENFGIPTLDIILYYNDEIVSATNFWQFNYCSVIIQPEQMINKIAIIGKDEYNYGTMINLYSEKLDGTYEKNFAKLTQNQFFNVSNSVDKISASINVDTRTLVFTSIPYDKGWSVYVDGKKTSFEKVNLGFIGINLDSGSHEIIFKYISPFAKIGFIISAISLFLLIILNFIINNKTKK